MGEVAEDMVEGRCCCVCGEWLEEYLSGKEPDGFGYPVKCENCGD